MAILPIDNGRYGTKEMMEIFSEQKKIDYQLEIEGAAAISQSEIGMISKKIGLKLVLPHKNSIKSLGLNTPHNTTTRQIIREKYKLDFDDYFAKNLCQLGPYIDDNLISNNVGNLTIHPRGRLLVRNICMNFDQYIQEPMHQVRYSRVI